VVDALMHGKALEQAKGDRGGDLAGHAGGPGHGQQVIAANSDLSALHGRPEVSFQDSLVKEHSCHFEVQIGNGTFWILVRHHGISDVWGALYAPDNWVHQLCPSKPDASGTKGTIVTVPNVGKRALDQLAHVSGTVL
jgi:hypothetical protein